MKIAQIAPIVYPIPPKKYGGTERVVYGITEELVKMGHDVTLFASGDSVTSAKLVSVTPKCLSDLNSSDPFGSNILSCMHFGLAYKMQEEFDIIHDHMGMLSLPTANLSKTPVVYTYHGPFTPDIQEIYSILNKPFVASISKNQGNSAKLQMNHIGTVYNGLYMDHYPFSEKTEGYLLFVGRITLEKGVHHAIEAAMRLKMPLIIAAKLETTFQPDVDYFEEKVKPYLSETIQWIGEVNEQERNKLMSKAVAFLHPVTWPEPFGLTLIESMACGTPVIGFNLGSIPELIKDGVSGFVVENVDEMVERVKMVSQIDRIGCRNYALTNFSARKMAEGYLALYEKILQKQKPKVQTYPAQPKQLVQSMYGMQLPQLVKSSLRSSNLSEVGNRTQAYYAKSKSSDFSNVGAKGGAVKLIEEE
jgi:glycosyltransferase involved in cell wall biosynthesis